MKYILISLVILCASCKKDDTNECIEERIANLDSEICSENATVKRYTFQGETTFAIYPGDCGADMPDIILDENCETLGSIGGFAGETDINGEDYYENATLEETIWSN